MQNSKINALRFAGFKPFDSYYSANARANAQRNLSEITHYVDTGTLRAFKSRITAARVSANGAIFFIVESQPVNGPGSYRGFRAVTFDLLGRVLHQTEFQNCTNDAIDAYYQWFNSFDVEAHYIEALNRKIKRMQESISDLETTVKILESESD